MNDKILISDAKRISKDRHYDMTIVIGIQEDGSGHIATYGRNEELCYVVACIVRDRVAPILFDGEGDTE